MLISICAVFIFSIIPRIKCAPERPHIIFIMVDDLGWNDVSFHGSLQIPTPNIDTLASNGVVLNNYYVQPYCTPSRGALLSGRHPIHLGLQNGVILGSNPAGLPLDVPLMPQYLKKLGYDTHAVGKWHLGFYKKEYTPIYRGFDTHFGYWLPFVDYYDHTFLEMYSTGELKPAWGHALRDNMKIAMEHRGKYVTNVLTDRTVNIIKKHDPSKPLFLYIAQAAVHTGNSYALFQAPINKSMQYPHIEDINRRIFAGMISCLDTSIGKIFKELDKKCMLGNSIFVVSTDNGGEAAGYRGGVGSNWPLRGNKGTLWEGGVRGVAFVWSPFLKIQPRINNNLMHITDWLPTLYHAAGGNERDLVDIYGQNVWNSISENQPSPRTELLHNIDPIEKAAALRFNNYKLVTGTNLNGMFNQWYGPSGRNNSIPFSAYTKKVMESDAWKVLRKNQCLNDVDGIKLSELETRCSRKATNDCNPVIAPCLFDIVRDPCEKYNIADKYPRIVKFMQERLKMYEETAVPVVNKTIDPKANPALYDNVWTNWQDV